jgi:hypothetical protein
MLWLSCGLQPCSATEPSSRFLSRAERISSHGNALHSNCGCPQLPGQHSFRADLCSAADCNGRSKGCVEGGNAHTISYKLTRGARLTCVVPLIPTVGSSGSPLSRLPGGRATDQQQGDAAATEHCHWSRSGGSCLRSSSSSRKGKQQHHCC